ncbi:MAG: winged helix-turn-helix transcriptional regulator [Rhizobiales bacterium]|nr:winged helix-turn-helix transcriptional regulator [Hyphomicrobiales bacterium]
MGNAESSDIEKSRIVLGLLESVERDGGASQRRLAAELGIALGLVNAYLKRCMKKGWVKVTEAPARRYAYYLTPHGFAEKSRLTVEFLSYSFSFFRAARADCAEALAAARAAGCNRIVLAGASDLAEIATICALDTGIAIVGVVDADAAGERFLSLPVIRSFEVAAERCDGVLLTDLKNPTETLARATDRFGRDRVFVPAVLTGRMRRAADEAKSAEPAS